MTEEKILELASTHVYKGWFDDDDVIEFAKAIQREVLLEAADKCDEDYRYKVLSKHLRRMAEELKCTLTP
jgi:hypothetical protein